MAGCSPRSGASYSVLLRLYSVLTVFYTCTETCQAATGGNGNWRLPSRFPKSGDAPLDKNPPGVQQKHHLPVSGAPDPSTTGRQHLPAVRGKNGDRTRTTGIEPKSSRDVKAVFPPGLRPSVQTERQFSTPQPQAPTSGVGVTVKQLGAIFGRQSGKNEDSTHSGRQARVLGGEQGTSTGEEEERPGAGEAGTRARDLKRFFEQGANSSSPDSGTLPSHSTTAKNKTPLSKNVMTPGTKANSSKELTSSANMNQHKLPVRFEAETRSSHASSTAAKPLTGSVVHSPPAELTPIYENIRGDGAHIYQNSAFENNEFRAQGGRPPVAPAAHKYRQTSTPSAKGSYRTDTSNAYKQPSEPVYDEINESPRQAVARSPHRGPSLKVSRMPRRLLTRPAVTSRRQTSGGRWSKRALFHVFSHTYLLLGLPLLLGGLVSGDQLLTLGGIVLFGGGSLLNLLSLAALRLRRVSPSEIIPMTAYNFEILFGVPSMLTFSIFTMFIYHVTTFFTAVISAGRRDFVTAVAPFSAFAYVLYFGVLMYLVYENVRYRRRTSAADPESAGVGDVESENGLIPRFEMVYFPTTAPGDGQSESEVVSQFSQRYPTLSRLFDYVSLNYYQPFLTLMGVTFTVAICLGRSLEPVFEVESMRDTSSLPLATDHQGLMPRLLRLMQLVPSYAHGEDHVSAASPSLLAIGGVGVLFVIAAIGNGLLRWIISCARCMSSLEPCWRRSNRGPRLALTYYPFAVGITAVAFGFLAAFMEVSRTPHRPFVHIMEYGTAIFGMLVALLPTLWTSLQSFGVSLSRVLAHFYQVEASRRSPAGSSQEHGRANQPTRPQGNQLPAQAQVPIYDIVAAESESFTEWDSDGE